ncbi:MAG: tyrosine-type recombinase/integrase [Anaerolineales bacterium]
MSQANAVLRKEAMQTTVAQAIDNYLVVSKLEGKSPETVIWHQKKLMGFLEFLQAELGDGVLVRDLSIDHGRAFIKHLMDRKTKYADHPHHREIEGGLAPSTINGFARSLKAFSSWLEEDGYAESNIMKRLKPPKVPRILIRPLTEDELRKILLAIPQDTPEGVRNFAIVLMFCDTGIRLSELVHLRVADFDARAGEFKVYGKGARERNVPIGRNARRAVVRYVEHHRPEPVNPQEVRLFLTVAGDPMSRNSIGKMVQRLARRTGLRRVHPNLFRHTFAVRYLTNGGDVFTLQKILGHKSLEMTRRYVSLASADVKETHRLYSPIDNLGSIGGKHGRPRRRRIAD